MEWDGVGIERKKEKKRKMNKANTRIQVLFVGLAGLVSLSLACTIPQIDTYTVNASSTVASQLRICATRVSTGWATDPVAAQLLEARKEGVAPSTCSCSWSCSPVLFSLLSCFSSCSPCHLGCMHLQHLYSTLFHFLFLLSLAPC